MNQCAANRPLSNLSPFSLYTQIPYKNPVLVDLHGGTPQESLLLLVREFLVLMRGQHYLKVLHGSSHVWNKLVGAADIDHLGEPNLLDDGAKLAAGRKDAVVEGSRVGKTSPGMMNVVVLCPKFWKKLVRQ